MKSLFLFLPVLLAARGSDVAGVPSQNVVVYREANRFAGWPANHGIWIWGDEIIVGFERGYFKFNDQRHSIDWAAPLNTSSPAAWMAADPGRSNIPKL